MAGSPDRPPDSVGRWLLRALGPAFLALGVGLIVYAVTTGAATFYLVVIFPVIVGNSALLILGATSVIIGVVLLPLSFAGREGEEDTSPARAPVGAEPTGLSSGGLFLIGPVPLFVGSWRSAPGWVYALAAAVGTLLVLLVVLAVLGFL